VQGGKLVPLQALASSAVVAPGAESWPDGLAGVLQKLGCFVLDMAGFELPLEALLQHCVHRPSGVGVAAAVCAALGWSGNVATGRQLSSQQQQAAERVGGSLGLDDVRILRSFLLQQRWFSGSAGDDDAGVRALLLVARQLPLFELANLSSKQQAEAATAAAIAQQGTEEGSEAEQVQQVAGMQQHTVALSPGCCLAPAGKIF
jgi:hypothetical protein